MADSNIGSLPQAQTLDDDSLLVAEQQGQAVKVTGAQFKEFGRQAVIGQVQGYVDQAEAAAEQAVSAVSAVTDMTVEASTLASGQNATVTKSTKNGKVNLAFGLPRGEQGIQGPQGETGPRGPQGPTGKGLTILGYYDTLSDLEAAVPYPNAGDAYGVGLIAPYNIYVFDGVTNEWKDNGQLSGGGGGVLPEDVVTAEGGAVLEIPSSIGDAPHTITFTADEDPLTADDVEYSETETVKDAIDGLKSSVSSGKALIASAITDKGVPTAQDATFQQMAENIGDISSGSDTSDATATSFDILAPKTAYTAAGKVEGVIPTLLGQTIMPGTADKTIANGQYLGGTQVIKGDPNLTSGNIKSGVTLFGVAGSLESTFQATLTVTADVGAVVTATHTDGTEVSALSQTGTVVFELPKEGTWSVTAVRGVAQYNTVTVQVSSSYSAALTAEVHIEYYGTAAALGTARASVAGASIGDYALFAGGDNQYANSNNPKRSDIDVYNELLSKSSASLSVARSAPASASTGIWAIFAGGEVYSQSGSSSYWNGNKTVDAFDALLTRSTPTELSEARRGLAGAVLNGYAIFAGGYYSAGGENLSTVDAYDAELVHTTPQALTFSASKVEGSANSEYAVFVGNGGNVVTAYNKNLTKTTLPNLQTAQTSYATARAGNYILLVGANETFAFDLFLTRTTPDSLSVSRDYSVGVTIQNFALFAGGGGNSDVVDEYDPFLVHTQRTSMSQGRTNGAAASVGNFALFASGDFVITQPVPPIGGHYPNTVEVYQYV